jgi:hypothetical protein
VLTLRTLTTIVVVFVLSMALCAQSRRITVVDQQGLPIPGVTVRLLDGNAVRREAVTDAEGGFELISGDEALSVSVTLDGFQPAQAPVAGTERIVLQLAATNETTTVVADLASTPATPTALKGSSLNTTTVARLPSSHMHARESLPLLPSVVRGADGLMQLGGARAYQTPLTLDGFNVTDPATGLSSLNLPLEAMLSIDALRDPMSVNYGGLLGGLIRMESRAGGSMPAFGVQGFVPRPRFSGPGAGRIEGIFPRAHFAGKASGGRLQYAVSAEFDYERIPVPEVTEKTDRDLIESSGIVFARVDAQLTPRSTLTVEAFSFPSGTQSYGLSPRRDVTATVDLSGNDRFVGATHRQVSDRLGVITTRVGAFLRSAELAPNGSNETAILTPDGWNGNWFAQGARDTARYSVSTTIERPVTIMGASHEVSFASEVSATRLNGRIAERPVQVFGPSGALVREVTFGPAATVRSSDALLGLAVRDVWHIGQRAQLESGVRVDATARASTSPSARVGLRYSLDESGRTILKSGLGTFVGAIPLASIAFANYPRRTDTWYDEETGGLTKELVLQPVASQMRLPQAVTGTIGIEREIVPGLDVQGIFAQRESRYLPTLDVPFDSGPITVGSNGSSSYREYQLSVRRTLSHDQMVFVSYVRSTSIGELNEFSTVFQGVMDTPLVEPGGRARTINDANHRVLAWGTINLPFRIVISPATEWRSGFTFSARSSRYTYAGPPNTRTFPSFLSTDLVAYKTFSYHNRSADFGVQVFNLMNRWNPRDVFPVIDEPRFGQFSNSVGRIIRGYMLVKW